MDRHHSPCIWDCSSGQKLESWIYQKSKRAQVINLTWGFLRHNRCTLRAVMFSAYWSRRPGTYAYLLNLRVMGLYIINMKFNRPSHSMHPHHYWHSGSKWWYFGLKCYLFEHGLDFCFWLSKNLGGMDLELSHVPFLQNESLLSITWWIYPGYHRLDYNVSASMSTWS